MLLKKKLITEKDGSGSVSLIATVDEDMWYAYNLITVGDEVRCSTMRKVTRESSTGSTSSSKMRLNLNIEVEKVEFDSQTCVLRLKGRNRGENQHVKLGAYHTLDLELNKMFTLKKECWDTIYLEMLQSAINPEKQAEMAAVVMMPGLAHICVITKQMTITKARIEMNIPRKRAGSSAHQKAYQRFFDAIYTAVDRHIDFATIKVALLGSPGFLREDWFKYAKNEAIRRDNRPFLDNKEKWVLCQASSGHKRAIEELFSLPSIQSRLADTKAAAEVAALGDFFRCMHFSPDKAIYGYPHVKRCIDEAVGAIDRLLVTDELFRSSNMALRRKYVDLVEAVKSSGGGQVHIFSSAHVSGAQLQQVSGVAAILRLPMPHLFDDEEDEQHHEEEGKKPTEGSRCSYIGGSGGGGGDGYDSGGSWETVEGVDEEEGCFGDGLNEGDRAVIVSLIADAKAKYLATQGADTTSIGNDGSSSTDEEEGGEKDKDKEAATEAMADMGF